MKRILIADDDTAILELLTFRFRQDGFAVTQARDGKEALDLALDSHFDFFLFDLNMPGYTGFELIRRLRAQEIFTPLLILTAREDDTAKLEGFSLGADDYLDKTTPLDEILARVSALIRRHQIYDQKSAKKEAPKNQETLHFLALPTHQELVLDPQKKAVKFDGEVLTLTRREYELLVVLIEANGEVRSRDSLLKRFWGHEEALESRTIDVLISRLRKKLNHTFIKSKRGFGYYFEATHQK